MPTARPNVVFFLPDQLRPDFLGCYGADFLRTPAIDSLAARAIRYTRAVSSAPECVPARTALMTGMHPVRNNVTNNNSALRPDHLSQGISTWPALLSDAGYSTAAVGKMHFYPWDDRGGFQRRVVAEDKRHVHVRDDYFHYLRERGLRRMMPRELPGYVEGKGATLSPVPYEHSGDAFTARAAADFIRSAAGEQPFALMVGFPGPHDPYDPDPEMLRGVDRRRLPASIPEVPGDNDGPRRWSVLGHASPALGLDYTEFTEDSKRNLRYHYAGLVQQIDRSVATVLSSLDEAGVGDNTIVIFASDHGDYLGDHNLASKSSHFESAIRIPLLLAMAGQSRAEVCDDLVDLYDLAPTILSLAGVDVPSYMDAVPLPGTAVSEPRTSVLGVLDRSWMLHNGRYKLQKYYTGECLLFDLAEDPLEQNNLVKDPSAFKHYLEMDAELTAQLMAMLIKGREHTTVIGPHGPVGVGDYNREGWNRTYPHPVGNGTPLPRDGVKTTWQFATGYIEPDSRD